MDSINKIQEALGKELDKAMLEATAAPAKPVTVPTTPTKPSKPKNPLVPTPGVKPKPKANKDVELFLKARADRLKKKDNVEEAKDVIKGGKADCCDDDEFDAGQLKKGIKVEAEHTDNKEIAKEIAKDHLSEFDRYYDALKQMEDKLKNESVNEMAFETGGREDIVSPDKKAWIEGGEDIYNEILPTLTDEEQTYLEKISSKSYQDCIDRIKKYTGITAPLNVPTLYGMLFNSIKKIQSIEKKYAHFLEDIALENILAMDEFKLVKSAYDDGNVKFDLKLKSGELQNAISEQDLEVEEGLSEADEINGELFDKLKDVDEAMLQRRVANILIQGKATQGLYLFNMMKEDIDRIDPSLMKLYGIVATGAQIGYFAQPFGVEPQAAKSEDMSAGSEEVEPDGDGYTIKCRGMVFPYLIHEVIKGIYEWVSLTEEHQGAMEKDTLEAETKDIMVGTEVAKAFQSYIPSDKTHLTPLVHKLFIKLDKNSIKEVLKKSQAGKTIMASLLEEAEAMYDEYNKEPEDTEEWSEPIEAGDDEWNEDAEVEPFNPEEWEKDWQEGK